MLQPIVVDNGTGSIKMGFAGAEEPAQHFPNFVGRPKLPKIMVTQGLEDQEILIGDRADEHRGLLKLSYPMSHGVVQSDKDWSDIQKIWEYAFNELGVQSTEQHPILLSEPPHNPRKNRGKAAEILFENFSSPALSIQINAILSLYASGRTTGVVLDSGDGVTCTVPVFEGFALRSSIVRSDVAGRDVTEYLRLLLRQNGVNLDSTAEFEIVKNIKETKCSVLTDSSQATKDQEVNNPVSYSLPDGRSINISTEKFQAPEVLFNPLIIGLEYPGMHECLAQSIANSDADVRKRLFANIFLSGGSTMFSGLGDRLLSELRSVSPRDTAIRIYAPKSRLISTWLGGSILASLRTFKTILITRKRFEEEGKRVVYTKPF